MAILRRRSRATIDLLEFLSAPTHEIQCVVSSWKDPAPSRSRLTTGSDLRAEWLTPPMTWL
ncbi:hypothetical protein PC116_g8406 [Phytophthora cactorum]|uniref:Uncharacterized protein n=1 Tax=Phytophthora cactorum TaxID=29920 RepID=A0A8T1L4W9_9STRA|nr:hypothetical protein Pcac1_g23164 [Phytophthora cactorum]KAG2898093.1 hypothetical protein PC114_g14416 [Phytophthora cactorum]KAG2948394.1 hypothetical protein PC117_g6059 [Phytophthora cactorum]KAG3016393.1 hypothetical protein PC120_g11653 [Phytophthora cactorum]KAG3027381.1 hypothetical protein PC119_g7399 [Phytophthora cactorum]